METVSELTGWVQIDGCPLSDYTTGPLNATRQDLCTHKHPSVLTLNGPIHLTRVNISRPRQSVCVCVFVLSLSVWILNVCAYYCLCAACACMCVTDWQNLSLNWTYLGRISVQVSSFLSVLGKETKWRLFFFPCFVSLRSK